MSKPTYKVTGKQPLSPKAIKIAPELASVQALMPMALEDRAALRDSIEKDGIREALRGYYDKLGDFLLLSGYNRLQIALELDLSLVPTESVDVSDREAFAVDENRARRQLTTAQKRNLAEYLLRKDAKASNRVIARQTGLDHKTVDTVRKQAEHKGTIAKTHTRRDSVGREQPAVIKTNKNKGKSRDVGNFPTSSTDPLRAFTSDLNAALRRVELEPADTLKQAVGVARSWLKELERKAQRAQRQ